MLKLTIVNLSRQVYRGSLPSTLVSELRREQVWICRRFAGEEIVLLTSDSPHMNGRVLLIFPDKESVRLRSRDGEAFQMTFEETVMLAEKEGYLGLVLMMGSAWVEMDLFAAKL